MPQAAYTYFGSWTNLVLSSTDDNIRVLGSGL